MSDKKKVLLITKVQPYPLRDGGTLAQYYFIDGLKDRFSFVLCSIVREEFQKERYELLCQKQSGIKINYVDFIKPKQKATLKSKLKFLVKRGPKRFVTSNEDDFLDSYYQRVDNLTPIEFIDLINRTIREEEIGVVQLDFYDCIDLVFALPDYVKKIFIHHEVRFKRLETSSKSSSCSEEYKNYLINKNRAFELSCLQHFDEVVVFNANDADSIRPYCKKITVSPFAIADEQIFPNDSDYHSPHLLFMGAEGHTPNAQGLKWFLDEIYIPNLEKINMPLYVTGTWSNVFIQNYTNVSSIRFLGVVEHIEEVFHDSILVNPIKSGAGLRTKVLLSMANGIPVFSTRFGAEGCYSETETSHIAFFDSPEEFMANFLLRDFVSLARKGKQYYECHFSKEKLLSIREKVLSL